MLRVCFHIPVMAVLVPGYLAAILFSFRTPAIFTSIAFDSGGVASGPMTATFLLPFAMGACTAVGGNVLMDAFGVVALVAMTPLITVQVMGLVAERKKRKGGGRKCGEVTGTLPRVDASAGATGKLKRVA